MVLAIREKIVIEKKISFSLVVSCLSAATIITGCGCSITWTSPILSKLQSNDSNVNPLKKPITPEETSLIAGLFWLGAISGTIFFGLVVDRIGRKNTIIYSGILQILAYITLAFATDINLYYAARLAMGISTGALGPCCTMYATEIAESHNRGRFIAIIMSFVPIGSAYAYILGVCFEIKLFTLLCSFPCLIGVIVFVVFASESHIYLLAKGDRAAATKTLKKLRKREEIADDLAEIDASIKKIRGNAGIRFSELLSDRATKKGLVIGIGVALLAGFSGAQAIMAFLGPTFDSAGINVSGNTIAIAVGLVKCACFIFSSAIVEKVGRRPLMLISSIFAALSLNLLGFYFQFKDRTDFVQQYLWWLPVICIVSYIITYSVGIGPMYSVVSSEIVPDHIRSKSMSFVTIINKVCILISTFGFPLVQEYFGIPACFFFFGLCCVFGTVFVYFMLPETKGKTFSEIAAMLAASKQIYMN